MPSIYVYMQFDNNHRLHISSDMNNKGRNIRIHIAGTCPYGFRIISGSCGQSIVTKLRPKSKAATAGLMDGDVITAVNGYSISQVSHDRVMSLIEHAGHFIDLDVWRSSENKNQNHFIHAAQRSQDWDYYDSAPDSPSFDMLASQYESERLASVFNADNEMTNPNFGFDRQSLRGNITPSPRRDSREQLKNTIADLRWNPDRSVTMSLDLVHEKENQKPAVTHRNEAFLIINSPLPKRQAAAWHPSPVRSQSVQSASSYDEKGWRDTSSDSGLIDVSRKFGPLPPQIVKIITPGSDSDTVPEELLNKKKRVFADSSFFDDSRHSYPTIEEQIKMARKVAQSLMAPVNQDTRGHQMFMKRKETLVTEDIDDLLTSSIGDPSPYYNPTPWKSNKPWSPASDGDDNSALPYSSRLYSAARLIPSAADENSSKAMSADEFERVRLFDQKSTHDTMSPHVCFSLANDLRNSNSKGGRMFAKRRAKADQWTVENQPKQEAMDKINIQYANNQKHKVPAGSGQQNDTSSFVIPKLQTELPRARITPWDAAVHYGNVEPAFQHLSDVSFIATPNSSKSGPANRTFLTSNASASQPAPFTTWSATSNSPLISNVNASVYRPMHFNTAAA